MQRPFSYTRRPPLNVMLIIADMPLVRVDGNSLHELREDVFDAAFESICCAGAFPFDTYAAAMSGGEPYAKWD